MRRKRERKKTNLIKLMLVLLIVICIMPGFYSGARFVYRVVHEHYVSSKDFYFKSDKLNEEHSEFQATNNWSGSETYRLIINMSSKKNDMAYTASDIDYDISFTYSDNISCTASKNSGTIPGTQNGGVNEDYFIIFVNPAQGTTIGSGQTAWVDITATSTSPYSKTIGGKIIIETGSASVSYEIIDAVNSPYLTLNITNASTEGKNITLSYDPSLILLDMTNPFATDKISEITEQLNNNTYINTITSYVQPNYNISIKFYKEDKSQDYTYLGTGTPIITLTY